MTAPRYESEPDIQVTWRFRDEKNLFIANYSLINSEMGKLSGYFVDCGYPKLLVQRTIDSVISKTCSLVHTRRGLMKNHFMYRSRSGMVQELKSSSPT